MISDELISQLYADHAFTANLQADDAEQLLSWAESRMTECETDEDALRMLDAIRLLNRYVKEGGAFEELFAALRVNSFRSETAQPAAPRPEEFDPEIEKVYPPEE